MPFDPRLVRWMAAASVIGVAVGTATASARAVLPRKDGVARGVLVQGEPVRTGETPGAAAERRASELLDRVIHVTWEGDSALEASIRDLGGSIDTDALARTIAAVGRRGGLVARLDDALEARRGHVDVRVPIRISLEELASRLARFKDERDAAPRDARLDVATRTATEDAPGRYVDVYGIADAVEAAIANGEDAVAVHAFEIPAHASRQVVATIDTGHVVSRFETHFGYLGGQRSRAQNVQRAASLMDGVVLMPGEIVSFNHNVGPRSVENGFASAPEIYKGEMREGIGGGTCQVASTLHAAAVFGGLDIVERINHSRPSGYIPMGLDATVVYPAVDLKLRNPFEFPVVVHSSIDKGTLAFELYGKDKPAKVDFSTSTIKVEEFKRKIEEAPWLPAGKFVKKQKGIKGYAIKRIRAVHLFDGQERVDVTKDVYPPTLEIYLVPPGTDESALPPLPNEGPSSTGDV